MRFRLLFCAFLLACGSDPISGFDDGGADAPLDQVAAFTLRVDPLSLTETVTLGTPPPGFGVKAFRKDANGETDVTTQVSWAVDSTALASVDANGAGTLKGLGGKSKIHATLAGVDATADLVVKLTGDGFAPPADGTTKSGFAAAQPDPADPPLQEYPGDGVVLPGNLPAIEFQWSQAGDNASYRLHLTSPDILDVYVYGTQRELKVPDVLWALVGASTADKEVTWTVEATGPTKKLHVSAPRKLTIAADVIDNSAIYVWQSSTGSFRILDIAKGKDFPLPTNSPQLQPSQPCSGCHRISRDGKRFAFTYNGGNFNFGSLAYNDTTKSYDQKIVPNPAFRATYAAFNPSESSQVPAMLVTVPDNVPQNTAGSVHLELRHPETNAVVPSNLAAMTAQLSATGNATSMPDWSPDGSFVVFSAYDATKNYVRLLGDDIVLASVVEAPVTFANGTFQFGAPKVLVAANSAGNPDTGLNNVLPVVSPDGSAVAYTVAHGWWSIKTQVAMLNLSGRIAIVRRSDSQVLNLENATGPDGSLESSTWPQWAPTLGQRFAWLAFASERPYGHLVTAGNSNCGALVQGQKKCKQLWVTAVDLSKMKAGTVDPSATAFWIPGQNINAQYVSPQWTKAVLAPPN